MKRTPDFNAEVEHESGRGRINDNALKALVTSPLFRTRTEKAKKGKGSYNRKAIRKGHQQKGDAPFDFMGENIVIGIYAFFKVSA